MSLGINSALWWLLFCTISPERVSRTIDIYSLYVCVCVCVCVCVTGPGSDWYSDLDTLKESCKIASSFNWADVDLSPFQGELTPAHTHTNIHTYTHSHTHSLTHTHAHMHTHTRIHTHTHTHSYTLWVLLCCDWVLYIVL